MTRVLVVGMTDNPGGMESVVMNYLRHIDKSLVKFDFLSYFDKIAYQDELEKNGSRCFVIPPKGRNLLAYRKKLKDFFRTYHDYDCIWFNTVSLANIDFLILARKYKIKKRIVHAHNSKAEPSFVKNLCHKMNRKRIGRYATDFWSCSEDSSEFFYDEKIRRSPYHKIIQNAIDLDIFHFDPAVRETYRKKLGLSNCFVIGNVGRFLGQKNHEFIIDVFEACLKKNERARLLLVGQGELFDKIKERVRKDGIEKEVIFLGVRPDVPEILQAMDVFLFPSLFEGLPMALMEAEAEGLPCITSSKAVPKKADITGLVTFLDLSEPAETWAEYVLKAHSDRSEDYSIMISDRHFNIEKEASKLEAFFQGKKFQIAEHTPGFHFAGSKAPADVERILSDESFEALEILMSTEMEGPLGKVMRQIRFSRDWKRAVKRIENDSLLFIQFPFHHPQLTREKALNEIKYEKNVKIIGLVHDIEELRGYRNNDYYRHEFEFMLEMADVLIVHNDKMKDFLVSRGFDSDHIVVLGTFDYLVGDREEIGKLLDRKPAFERSLSLAGNLDPAKSGYMAELCKTEKVDINLYGTNFDQELKKNPVIHYHGVFSPEELPGKISSGFGLVWDGDSIESCQGPAGNYLRYNNPHKLSLYLAAGLPVFIWREAAEAALVKENNLGFTVSSVREAEEILNKISESEYNELVQSVKAVEKKILNGGYTRTALCRAMDILKK